MHKKQQVRATLNWYLRRPKYWHQAASKIWRKLYSPRDGDKIKSAATRWAEERSVSLSEALVGIGLISEVGNRYPEMSSGRWQAAEKIQTTVPTKMGGAGHLGLLYACVKIGQAKDVVETGVAYGWSSLAILDAQTGWESASLVSVDMPYAVPGSEDFVGALVPHDLKNRWTLIREADRPGIVKAIHSIGGKIDLCHYDSDKSYQGRMYAYPILWDALRPGGIFISDDIGDNFGFRDFMLDRQIEYFVIAKQGFHVGVARKPM